MRLGQLPFRFQTFPYKENTTPVDECINSVRTVLFADMIFSPQTLKRPGLALIYKNKLEQVQRFSIQSGADPAMGFLFDA